MNSLNEVIHTNQPSPQILLQKPSNCTSVLIYLIGRWLCKISWINQKCVFHVHSTTIVIEWPLGRRRGWIWCNGNPWKWIPRNWSILSTASRHGEYSSKGDGSQYRSASYLPDDLCPKRSLRARPTLDFNPPFYSARVGKLHVNWSSTVEIHSYMIVITGYEVKC